MPRLLIAAVSVAVVLFGFTATAGAAPKEDNKNVELVPVVCEGLGSFDVITMENAATAFRPDGSVLVAKRFGGEFTGTITTNDGATFPFSDSFEEGPPGQGFEDRLIECNFTETESETFILDAEFAEFAGIPESYVGTQVTLAGTFNGTAWVFAPGPE